MARIRTGERPVPQRHARATVSEPHRAALKSFVRYFPNLRALQRRLGFTPDRFHEALTGGRLMPPTVARCEVAIERVARELGLEMAAT